MKVFLLLCLAPAVLGFLPDDLGGEVSKFTACLGAGSEASCVSCCDNTNFGLLDVVETPLCHAECNLLPAPAQQKRQLLGDVGRFANCLTKGSREACLTCCDTTDFGLLDVVETPLCHAECNLLPARAQQKRQLVEMLACDLLLPNADACNQCCEGTTFDPGFLGEVEELACHGTCSIGDTIGGIFPSKKRQLLGEAGNFLKCEATGHRAPCEQCCNTEFSGNDLLHRAERTACIALCDRTLPQKRQLTGELGKFAACLGAGSHDPCIDCCDRTFATGLLAGVERNACHLECRVLSG